MTAAINKKQRKIPSDLGNRIPTAFRMLQEQKIFWIGFGFCLCVAAAYGKIVGPPQERNGYLLIVGPVVLPLVSFLFRVAYPWNPFRTVAGRMFGGGTDDRANPESSKVLEILRSRGASVAAAKATFGLSAALLLTVVAIVAARHEKVSWSFEAFCWNCSAAIPLGILGCIIGASIIIHAQLASCAIDELRRLSR